MCTAYTVACEHGQVCACLLIPFRVVSAAVCVRNSGRPQYRGTSGSKSEDAGENWCRGRAVSIVETAFFVRLQLGSSLKPD